MEQPREEKSTGSQYNVTISGLRPSSSVAIHNVVSLSEVVFGIGNPPNSDPGLFDTMFVIKNNLGIKPKSTNINNSNVESSQRYSIVKSHLKNPFQIHSSSKRLFQNLWKSFIHKWRLCLNFPSSIQMSNVLDNHFKNNTLTGLFQSWS